MGFPTGQRVLKTVQDQMVEDQRAAIKSLQRDKREREEAAKYFAGKLAWGPKRADVARWPWLEEGK